MIINSGFCKNTCRIQTMIKIPVKFQKDRPKTVNCKTVGGVALTRYLLPIHFHSILAQKRLS